MKYLSLARNIIERFKGFLYVLQPLKPGTFLFGGKYKIDHVAGHGTHGIVYVGHNQYTMEKVAIKEFFMDGVSRRKSGIVSAINSYNVNKQDKYLKYQRKEAQYLRDMRNEHIPRVFDMFDENGTSYYVMEHVEGYTLSRMKLKKHGWQFSESEVICILLQLLETVKAMHIKGLYYTDFHTDNIMIDKNGKVYLIDFGRVKLNDNLCMEMYTLGGVICDLLNCRFYKDHISENMRELISWLMNGDKRERPKSPDELLAKIKSWGE